VTTMVSKTFGVRWPVTAFWLR